MGYKAFEIICKVIAVIILGPTLIFLAGGWLIIVGIGANNATVIFIGSLALSVCVFLVAGSIFDQQEEMNQKECLPPIYQKQFFHTQQRKKSPWHKKRGKNEGMKYLAQEFQRFIKSRRLPG